MLNVIEGNAHGLGLDIRNDKITPVIEPTGDIYVREGDKFLGFFGRLKIVTYKNGVTEMSQQTKLPVSPWRAVNRYWEDLVPEGDIIGSISEDGDTTVYSRVATGEEVQFTGRLTRNRGAKLLSSEENWLGFRRVVDRLRVPTAHLNRWDERNRAAQMAAAASLMRNGDGRIVFAHNNN